MNRRTMIVSAMLCVIAGFNAGGCASTDLVSLSAMRPDPEPDPAYAVNADMEFLLVIQPVDPADPAPTPAEELEIRKAFATRFNPPPIISPDPNIVYNNPDEARAISLATVDDDDDIETILNTYLDEMVGDSARTDTGKTDDWHVMPFETGAWVKGPGGLHIWVGKVTLSDGGPGYPWTFQFPAVNPKFTVAPHVHLTFRRAKVLP